MEEVSRIDMSEHNMSRLDNVNSRKFCIIAFSVLFVTLLSQVKSLLDTLISLSLSGYSRISNSISSYFAVIPIR